MQTLDRRVPKSQLGQYENCDGLTEEMKARMTEYLFSLHGIKENTKDDYLSKVKMLGRCACAQVYVTVAQQQHKLKCVRCWSSLCEVN